MNGDDMNNFDAAAYSIVVTKVHEDGEDLFFAYVKEIPDISSYSERYQDAYDDCIDSLNVLYADAMENGKAFPMPYKAPSPSAPSGRVTLRMSRSMHADIARYADEDGVSLNYWIVEAIAQRRGFHVAKQPTSATLVSLVNATFRPFLGGETSGGPDRSLQLSSSEDRYVEVQT